MEKKSASSNSSSSSTTSASFSFFFKRLNKIGVSGGAWRWKLKSAAGLRWKRRFNLHLWFVDDVLFKIVSVCEGIVLVSTLCCFFVCCGCHF